jgi:dipeptidyl aminopeptidase/acylaminoacyl peptidase
MVNSASTPTSPRRKRSRLVSALLVGLLVIGFALYSVAAWVGYDTATLPRPPYPPLTPAAAYEEVQFAARGQTYRVNAFLQRGAADAPALINVHGYRGTRYSEHSLTRAAEMLAMGYTVLTIDLSDNGGSTIDNGRISFGYSERWDVLGAFDFLLERGFSAGRIGLVGESMGAATSLLAAAAEPRIRAVWEDSGYTSALQVLAEQSAGAGFPSFIVPGALVIGVLRTGDRLHEADPLGAAGQLAANGTQVQVVHCQEDAVVLPHHGPDLYNGLKSAGVTVDFWSVGCTQHARAFYFAREEYNQRLDAFFKAALAPATAS